ncbi:MAG: DUF1289 domain-containing protein [Halioglobus sp.]|nr:DUF1289 domain-containing protein [Halioglobus sp.]
MTDEEPKSPCISICTLDEHDICEGCFRSANEITDWLMADAEARRDILRRAAARRKASSSIRLG